MSSHFLLIPSCFQCARASACFTSACWLVQLAQPHCSFAGLPTKATKAVYEREAKGFLLSLTVKPVHQQPGCCTDSAGLRIKETKEVYEGEVTELTPVETENPGGGYGKVCRSCVCLFCSAHAPPNPCRRRGCIVVYHTRVGCPRCASACRLLPRACAHAPARCMPASPCNKAA